MAHDFTMNNTKGTKMIRVFGRSMSAFFIPLPQRKGWGDGILNTGHTAHSTTPSCSLCASWLKTLSRISHHPSTTTAHWHALLGVRSVGVLDRLSSMPARSLVTNAKQGAPLNRLATNGGEKCGLVGVFHGN